MAGLDWTLEVGEWATRCCYCSCVSPLMGGSVRSLSPQSFWMNLPRHWCFPEPRNAFYDSYLECLYVPESLCILFVSYGPLEVRAMADEEV